MTKECGHPSESDPCPICDWSHKLNCNCETECGLVVTLSPYESGVVCPKHDPERWARVSVYEKTCP